MQVNADHAYQEITVQPPDHRTDLEEWTLCQNLQLNKEIIMHHIPGIICSPDDLTKPLEWILHSRHARRIMGHYTLTGFRSSSLDRSSSDQGKVSTRQSSH